MKSFIKIAGWCLSLCWTLGAYAQIWDSNTIQWTGPTQCSTGQNISECAPTGYRIERSNSLVGTFSVVATVGVVSSYTHNGAPQGLNCYRVITLSARGDSSPSTVTNGSCRTNTPPVGPPNPPTNVTVIATTVFNLWMEGDEVMLGQVQGTIPLGTPCGEQNVGVDEEGEDGHIYRPVAAASVTPINPRKPIPRGTVLVAACG